MPLALQSVCNHSSVISVEQFPLIHSETHVTMPPTQSLMYSDSHTEFLAVLTIDKHSASNVGIQGLNDLNSPLLHAQTSQGPP